MVNKISESDFDGQRPDESTLFVFRRSLFTIKRGIFLLLFVVVITTVPFFWLGGYINTLWFVPVIGFIIGILCLLHEIFIWYFSVYIVTDQRVRYIDQKKFFSSEVIDLSLSKIENISYNVSGLFGAIIGFGTIVIQTLAGDLVIHNVARPDVVYNRLQDLINKQTAEKKDDQSFKEDSKA